ncbi:YkgJ family cysteine cluster protein [Aporhodopirellula aestuarii]|uniref:YkgJ family cysteine cluster protein n=1 Tax=Aporhodopirellula aestuarii TaxID=2950107 RepID=A0ABT0U4K7_9BACT|nr:YkgJ family cysteine cluster protein [Aporhodopirellula aestuarii]MCM2371796.1 YkgJ family cysteine cluster protein [Aporhodopirellula aestuarii]
MPRSKLKPQKSDEAPWYADGLRFECTQCGKCCSGEPGYVFIDDAETAAMARELQMTVDEFEQKFTRRVGRQSSLVEYPDGDCIFLEPKTRHCMVYKSRPIQCRTWPFWDSTLETAADWKETCEVCPGAGTGRLYSFDEIEVRRKEKSV